MKDYRYVGIYDRSEWENDVEWKARRLQFLWDFSKLYSDTYSELKMYKEKNAFYKINDTEVGFLAASFNSYSNGEFERYKKLKDEECVEKYMELVRLKRNNQKEFLKKCNSNLYFYLREHRHEDMQEVLEYDYELKQEYKRLFNND